MHHHVAADHRQATEGAVEADVLGAVAVDDHVADGEGVVGGALGGDTVGGQHVLRTQGGRGVGLGGKGGQGDGSEASQHGHAEETGFQMHSMEPLMLK
jgi:hypothetical protein